MGGRWCIRQLRRKAKPKHGLAGLTGSKRSYSRRKTADDRWWLAFIETLAKFVSLESDQPLRFPVLSNGFSSIKMRSVGEQKKLHVSKFSETKKYSQKSLVFITTRGYFFAWLFPWLIAKQANRMALQRVVRLTCGSFLRRTVCPWWSPDEHSCQSPRQDCVTRPPPVTQTVTKKLVFTWRDQYKATKEARDLHPH